MPSTLKQWKLNGRDGYDCLKVQEAPIPEPEGNEVLIKGQLGAVKAVSLNYRDVALIFGKYPAPAKESDLTPVSDGAGEVVSLGPRATKWSVGDRVIPVCRPDWVAGRPGASKRGVGILEDGLLQEYMIVEEQALVPMPAKYSFIEASTLACAALTAWNALTGLNRVRPGDWVLTQGTGGVSIFAIQFAKAAGARVVGTTSSDSKAQFLRDLGVDHVINYKTDKNWGESARKLTPDGFDHVIEVGGAATLAQSVKAVAKDGTISLIGFLGQGEPPSLLEALFNTFIVRGIGIGNTVQFEEMIRCIDASEVKPVVDKVFKFDDAIEAYKHLESGAFTGKVVIEV